MPVSPRHIKNIMEARYSVSELCDKIDKQLLKLNFTRGKMSAVVLMESLPDGICDDIIKLYNEAGWLATYEHYSNQHDGDSTNFTFTER